jgi:DNA-binding CsgD family transcriptional regulator
MKTTNTPENGLRELPNPVHAIVREFAIDRQLSHRETDVLLYALQGFNRKEVALSLGCSPCTVNTYWRRILRKTKRSSQSELFVAVVLFALVGRADT